MFDTHVTIVGNVLTAPQWRRTTHTNSLVANFKVASTARRWQRETGQWIDGNSLRVRVNCWRRLAEGVASSIMVGDPVLVVGRLYTRDWTDADGNNRTLYELEAVAVGHDLARGRGTFARLRPTLATSTVEDADADARVHGETSQPVPPGQAPTTPGGARFADEATGDLSPSRGEVETLAALRGGGFVPEPLDSSDPFDSPVAVSSSPGGPQEPPGPSRPSELDRAEPDDLPPWAGAPGDPADDLGRWEEAVAATGDELTVGSDNPAAESGAGAVAQEITEPVRQRRNRARASVPG